jgi:hypothetical protein
VAYGNTKQNQEKKNGIGRNGRAGRFAMVFFLFIFNFQVSLPLSFCLAWCSFLVQVETNKQTRLRACYFSFFLPLGIACLLALMKHGSFYWVVIRGRGLN